MQTSSVRIATREDLREMHGIRLSVRENRLSDPGRIGLTDYEEILDSGGRAWVAEADGRIVGFAVADLARSNVWALFIEPGHEGRGVGRRLHETMMDWVFAAGTERAWLSTDPRTRAASFYRAAGWTAVGTEPNGELRFEMTREGWLRRP